MPVAEGRQPMQPGGDSPAPGANVQRRKASPEEQRAYEDFVGQLINVAYDEGTANVIVSQLREGGDPVETLANAAALVVSTVAASAGKNNVEVSRPMIVRATAELVGDMGKNLTKASGVEPLDDKQFQGTYLRTMDLLGQQASNMRGQNGGPPQEEGEAPPQEAAVAPRRGGRGLMPRMGQGRERAGP